MIIGVDSGALSIDDNRLKVGVYRVIENLLGELGKLDTKNDYRIFSFNSIEKETMKLFGPRMKNVVVKPRFGWSRIQLPLHLRLHSVDVFLGLSQYIPLNSAFNIGLIYDLGFYRFQQFHPGSFRKLKENTDALVARSNVIVTVSQASKRDIMKIYKVPSKRIVVAYPGVSEVFTRFGKVHREERPYFLFVGALKRGKNIPRIIQAFSLFLANTKTPYRLIFVGGDFWRDKDIDRELAKLSRSDAIQFTGYIPDERLAEYYRGARALVSPSEWEGFCLPAAEAMSCGIPVIGSQAGSLPEVVGKAGLLINPHDELAIAKAMKAMATGGVAYRKMKEIAVQQSKLFSWNQFAKTFLSLYPTSL